MNIPQGTPSNACPITSTSSESAKKEMKMVAFMRTKANMVVHRYPRTLVIGPVMKTPTKAPHWPAWNSELCHFVGIMLPEPSTKTP
jgi:hypothetical protein